MTSMTDGRGIVTQYVYNQLNQLVETINAAQVPGVSANEPLPLTAFGYIDRYFYDANGNLVLSQVEDYGDTSNVRLRAAGGLAPQLHHQHRAGRRHLLRRHRDPVRHPRRPGRPRSRRSAAASSSTRGCATTPTRTWS